MPDDDDQADEGGEPVAGVQSSAAVQTAAKWLMTAFAGIGGVIVAGLQVSALTSAKDLSGGLLTAAVSCYGVAILAVGTIILAAARVLLPPFDTLGQLAARQADAMAKGARKKKPAESIDELLRAIRLRRFTLFRSGIADNARDLDQRRKAVESATTSSLASGSSQFDGVSYTTAQLQALALASGRDAEAVVGLANTWEALHRFRQLRLVLVIGGLAAAAAVAGFALALRPMAADPQDPDPVAVTTPLPVTVFFPDAGAAQAVAGVDCRSATLEGAAVSGTLADPVVVTNGTRDCGAARFRVSEADAIAVPIIDGS